jgi:hypothetical protein
MSSETIMIVSFLILIIIILAILFDRRKTREVLFSYLYFSDPGKFLPYQDIWSCLVQGNSELNIWRAIEDKRKEIFEAKPSIPYEEIKSYWLDAQGMNPNKKPVLYVSTKDGNMISFKVSDQVSKSTYKSIKLFAEHLKTKAPNALFDIKDGFNEMLEVKDRKKWTTFSFGCPICLKNSNYEESLSIKWILLSTKKSSSTKYTCPSCKSDFLVTESIGGFSWRQQTQQGEEIPYWISDCEKCGSKLSVIGSGNALVQRSRCISCKHKTFSQDPTF